MTSLAIGLVLLSALAHALWNLLAKHSGDRLVFLWFLNTAVAVLLAPFGLYLLADAQVPARGWVYIAGTGVLHIAYFWSLGRSYSSGDLSLVYPLARGVSPMLVVLFAVPLFGEYPSPTGMAGIILIVIGVYSANLTSLQASAWSGPLRSILRNPGSRYALLTGLVIACYTLWDRAGVLLVTPLLYGYFVFAIPAIAIAPYMLVWRRDSVKAEFAKQGRRACLAGALSYGAYGLVLTAFTLSKVSYVAAAREVGILFGVLLGTLFLGEKHGSSKLIGASLIFIGIVLISVAT